MFKTFTITICEQKNSAKTYDLDFNIYNTDIAQKWAYEISQNYPLYEQNRFKSWSIESNKEAEIIKDLNKVISGINKKFEDFIPITVKEGTDQQTLNFLHKKFEILRGRISEGSNLYNTASEATRSYIERLNILIHKYEDFLSSKPLPNNPNHPFASIVGTFFNRPRIRLSDEDYNQFTFDWRFGEVYINYCEVGKPILDVFKDEDDIVGIENIRPLHYYSADFMIKFGPEIPQYFHKERVKKLNEWLQNQNISNNKYLSIGLIPVAKFIYDKHQTTQEQIIKKYAHCDWLERVWVE